ncbi:MAG: hypothetical protein IJ228_06265 [Succinivibrio sp.]|nr:hypothetical protein [Succinivibrio sp.]
MSKSNFLKAVELETASASQDKLRAMVRVLADSWPGERHRFFSLITETVEHDGKDPGSVWRYPEDELPKLQKRHLAELKTRERALERLSSGRLKIECDFDEDYDESEHNNGSTFIFRGPQKASMIILLGSNLADNLCDCALYAEALSLVKRFATLRVKLKGDGVNVFGQSMSFTELCERLDWPYLTLLTFAGVRAVRELYRGEALYKESYAILKAFNSDHFQLLINWGGDRQERLAGWLDCLAKINESFAHRMVELTLGDLKDPAELLYLARRLSHSYPQLYRLTYEALVNDLDEDDFDEVSMLVRYGRRFSGLLSQAESLSTEELFSALAEAVAHQDEWAPKYNLRQILLKALAEEAIEHLSKIGNGTAELQFFHKKLER